MNTNAQAPDAGTDTDRKPLPQIDIMTAFTQEPEPLDFVLPNLLAGTVGALVAPGGAGKSMLALQIATQIAAQAANGPDLLGIGKLTAGSVAYLPAEDPALVIQHRLHSLGKHMGPAQQQAIAKNLAIYPLLGMQPDLCSPRWQDALMRVADGRRLLIIDTLRRFHRLQEKDDGEMSAVIGVMENVAKDTGCAVIYLHHTNKASVLGGAGDTQQAARGSSVLIDNARWGGFLAGMTETEAKACGVSDDMRSYYVRFGGSKPNYGPPRCAHWLRRNEGGILLAADFSMKDQRSETKKAAHAYRVKHTGEDMPDWLKGPMESV